MKKSIFLIFAAILCATNAWAWCGNSFITVNGLWCTGSNSYVHDGGKFHGKDLGTLTTLELGGEFQVWPSSTTAGTLCYKIDDGTENSISLPKTGTEGNNSKHSGSGAVDLSGLAEGSHSIAVWFKHGSDIDNNSGSNFVATFTIAAATPEPEPEPEPEQTVTLYFVNHPEWTNLKAHVWDNNDTPYKEWNNSESMTDTGEDKDGYDVYSYTFPSKYTNIIFKGDGQQTQDNVAAYDVAKPYFCDDKWYASLAEIPALGAVVTYDYYVIGTVNSWTLKDANFGMTDDNADGVYEKVVTLADGKNQMKINNGTWDKQAGYDQLDAQYEGVSRGTSGDDNNIIINIATGKDITVKFDKNANKITLDGLTETAPEPEPTELTYNVTVPEGTNACYIAGDMNSWSFTAMTKVDDTHYTITITGAKKSDGYKYASGDNWGYVEKDANGNEIGDRTYVDGNDVVAKWAAVYDPDAVEQELTYSVTVPEGTYACYIAMDTDPAQDGWEFNEMTKVDETHYTYVRTGLKNKTYKYTSGPGWEYVELTDEDGNVADRQWAENDVVAKWTSVYNPTAPTYDYYVIGTVNEWVLKDAAYGMELNGDIYEKEVALAIGKNELKINNGTWDNANTFGYDNLSVAYEGVSRGSGGGDNNIVIDLAEAKTVTVKLDKNTKKITLDGLTEIEDYYTVVGVAELFGEAWATASETNKMVKQVDGSYKLVKENVTLAAIGYDWKIAKNGDWWNDAAIGVNPSEGNNTLTIDPAGRYNVTFTLAADLTSATVETELLEAAVVIPDCYISGNATLTGGEGWQGNEFTMVYDEETETWAYTLAGLQPEKEYELKVVCGGTWYSFANLATPVSAGITEGNDHSIAFKMAEAGDVTVTYNVAAGITISGNFYEAPTYDYYVVGTFNGWNEKDPAHGMTLDGEVYKATVTLAAGENLVKVTNGTWTDAKGYTAMGAEYEEVSQGASDDNIQVDLTEGKEVVVVYNATAGKITFEGLTKVEPETLVYTVEVPEGTENCYIAGQMNDWNFVRMTQVNATQWTITYDNVLKTTKYKYACQADWDYVEKKADGTDVADRTWTANDVVEKWNNPYTEVRTALTAGNYYTICMTKEMKEVKGATLWSFYGKDANFAYLVQENAPYTAGKAYIMYAEAETVSAILTGDEVLAPVANGAIHGTFAPMDQDALDVAGDNIYLVIGNQLRRVDGQTGNSLPANRAYVDIDEITVGAPAGIPANRVRSMPMQPQVATGMENVDASAQPVKMIIDGQLYILRGEKMYDAQGKLVK